MRSKAPRSRLTSCGQTGLLLPPVPHRVLIPANQERTEKWRAARKPETTPLEIFRPFSRSPPLGSDPSASIRTWPPVQGHGALSLFSPGPAGFLPRPGPRPPVPRVSPGTPPSIKDNRVQLPPLRPECRNISSPCGPPLPMPSPPLVFGHGQSWRFPIRHDRGPLQELPVR